MRTFTCFFVMLLIAVSAHAQQDPQFSQYMFNQIYFNPATAGINSDYIEFNAVYRSQWAGYTATFDDGGAPATQVVSASMPLNSINSGIGLHFLSDRLGPLSSTELMLSYAYHYDLGNGSRLSAGVRGGFYNQAIDFGLYRAVDDDDPLIPFGGRENQFKPDFAAGLYFSNPKYFGGIAFNHIATSDFDYGTEIAINSLQEHFSLIGGANFDISPSLLLSPSAILKSDLNTVSYEASVLLDYERKYFGGLSARASNNFDAAIFIVGMYFLDDNDLRLTYSLDYVTSGRNAKQPTSHEISLGYRIPAPQGAVPSPQRTPRFRF